MTGHSYSDHHQPISSQFADADIHVVTAGGIRISVHRSILASASPVLENIIDRPITKHTNAERTIPILGVPSEAVAVFVRFLYCSKCGEEEMDKYGFHVLTLSHVFAVPLLKQRCAKALVQRLKIDNVIDMLQIARLCDASELYFRSMNLISTNIKFVEKTEGWRFVQENDPWLELEILQFINEIESRKKRTRRHREERSLCLQISEAMECLEHICTEGCTNIGPYEVEPSKKRKGPCQKFATCEGLQLLFLHFANCKRRVNGGCSRCKRTWQLLQLHSSICDNIPDLCKVPLCRQFKVRGGQKGKRENERRWKVLVRKVAVAKAMSSLQLHKRDEGRVEMDNAHI